MQTGHMTKQSIVLFSRKLGERESQKIARPSSIAVLKKQDLTFRHIVKRRFLLPVTEAKLKLPL